MWGEREGTRWAYRGFGGTDLKKEVAEFLIARSGIQVAMAVSAGDCPFLRLLF